MKTSSHTPRNNNTDNGVQAAKEMALKRTSLKLDRCTTAVLDDNDLLLRNKRYSLNDRDLIMAMSTRKSSNTVSAPPAGDLSPELDNRPVRETTTGDTTTSGGHSEKDENENYCDGKEIDNKNGNDRIMDCGQLARVADNNDNNVDRNLIMMGDDGNKNRHSATTCEGSSEDVEETYHRLLPPDDEEEDQTDGDSDSKTSAGMASNSSSCCLSSGGDGDEGVGGGIGGASDDAKENRNSIASSSDESVELREKQDQDELQDEFDEQRQLLFGQNHHPQRNSRRSLDNSVSAAIVLSAEEPMDMLSPNEGPLARRYAEIAQFSAGKW